jgi:CheY-like chemotaxis protein
MGKRMADAVRRVRGREYKVQQAVGLYPTAGASDDVTAVVDEQIRNQVLEAGAIDILSKPFSDRGWLVAWIQR